MARMMKYEEPFQPLEPENKTPAHKRIVSKSLDDMVSQYFLISSEMRRLKARRDALRSLIADQIKPKGDFLADEIVEVAGKKVRLSPRYTLTIDQEKAVKLLDERNLLDRVATKVLEYRVKPSWARKIARRFWVLLENLGIAHRVTTSTRYEFDEDAIDQLYHAGVLTDQDIDSIVIRQPKGSGYALYIDEMEDEIDDAED